MLVCKTLTFIKAKIKPNIDIGDSLNALPIPQKDVTNTIFQSGITNNTDGCRYLYMDN